MPPNQALVGGRLMSSRGRVILAAPEPSGRGSWPGTCWRCTHPKVLAEATPGSDGGKGFTSFDQGRLCAEAVPEGAAVLTPQGVTNSTQASARSCLDLGGRESETVTAPTAAQCPCDTGRGVALMTQEVFFMSSVCVDRHSFQIGLS